MPIPLSQLETWSHQGAITTSSNAYAAIQKALGASSANVQVRGADIFLQGSYANSTNIYADSDIDVVVLYENTFHHDLSALSPLDQVRHDQAFPAAIYQWSDLHSDVLDALRAHFGSRAVTPGTKAIKVETGHGRMTADVVPAVQFRRYETFSSRDDLTAHWGIQFFDASGTPVVNYPRYHRERGEEKNQAARTAGLYKRTVRVFKNLRNYLYERGMLADGSAPSYFIECMLHNVPDVLFVDDLDVSTPNILRHLSTVLPATLRCQNGMMPLIGTGNTQWSEHSFRAFVSAAISAWNSW